MWVEQSGGAWRQQPKAGMVRIELFMLLTNEFSFVSPGPLRLKRALQSDQRPRAHLQAVSTNAGHVPFNVCLHAARASGGV